MIKTPLRYPGGKSRALETILALVPNFSEFREPFLGGGSVFLAMKQKYPKKKFWINDLYKELYHFWVNLRDNNSLLIKGVQTIKDTKKDGKLLHKELRETETEDSLEKAIRFFVLNRITFSGTIESGGYSQGAFEARFTQSSIDRLSYLEGVMRGTKITNMDYEYVIKEEGEDIFIFLDPPYFSATKSRLYGKKGCLHTLFDHEKFAEVMKSTRHQWMITYDDCPKVKELFSFAFIRSWEMQYGMNNYKQARAAKGKELIITNYSLPQSFIATSSIYGKSGGCFFSL